METYEWEKVKCRGLRIPPRDFHTATALEGAKGTSLIVFGGRIKWSKWGKVFVVLKVAG